MAIATATISQFAISFFLQAVASALVDRASVLFMVSQVESAKSELAIASLFLDVDTISPNAHSPAKF